MRVKIVKRLRSKRVWIGLCVALVFALVIGAIVAVKHDHEQRTAAVTAQYAAAKKLATTATSSSESLSRIERLTALSNLANTSVPAVEKCEGDWWSTRYANVLPSAGEDRVACKRQLEQLRSVAKIATQFNVYLIDDQKVAAAIKVITPTTAKDDWQTAALSSADSALRDVEAIAVTEDNKKVIAAATSVLNEIISAWAALNTADKKEDKSAYIAAKTALEDAYAGIGAVSDASDEQVVQLAARFNAQAQKL